MKPVSLTIHVCMGVHEGEVVEWSARHVDFNPSPTFYCPYCGQTLTADNVSEFNEGSDKGFLFTHNKDIHHDDIDFLDNTVH